MSNFGIGAGAFADGFMKGYSFVDSIQQKKDKQKLAVKKANDAKTKSDILSLNGKMAISNNYKNNVDKYNQAMIDIDSKN